MLGCVGVYVLYLVGLGLYYLAVKGIFLFSENIYSAAFASARDILHFIMSFFFCIAIVALGGGVSQ